MKKEERNIHNFLLKANTVLSAIVVFMEVITFDIGSEAVSFSCVVSLIWLSLFGYANKDRIERVLADD